MDLVAVVHELAREGDVDRGLLLVAGEHPHRDARTAHVGDARGHSLLVGVRVRVRVRVRVGVGVGVGVGVRVGVRVRIKVGVRVRVSSFGRTEV